MVDTSEGMSGSPIYAYKLIKGEIDITKAYLIGLHTCRDLEGNIGTFSISQCGNGLGKHIGIFTNLYPHPKMNGKFEELIL